MIKTEEANHILTKKKRRNYQDDEWLLENVYDKGSIKRVQVTSSTNSLVKVGTMSMLMLILEDHPLWSL